MGLNSYNLTKQSVVYGMFNQYIFSEVKSNIDLIERYFLMDVTTMANGLIKALLDAVRKYELSAIDEPLFRSILASQGKTDSESNSILQEIMKYKRFDSNQIDPIRKYIRGIGNQSLIDIASYKYQNDPEGFTRYLKNHNYKADYSDVFTVVNFDNIDINTIQATSMGGWKSSYDFINQSFQPMQKYENGQIVLVSAPPGCFTGDTKVKVHGQGTMTMKDLCNGFSHIPKFAVKTLCRDGHTIKLTNIVDCWITKYVTEIVEVHDNKGHVIRCTPDHRFLLGDSTYSKAEDLVPGTYLMSWNKDEVKVTEVKSVKLTDPIPVYDLEVDDPSHNFMLGESEVFVHNCGKTLFCINECLNMCLQGARCHYLALGDMNQKDFVQRMGAIYSGMSFGDVMINLTDIFNGLKMNLGGRFSLTTLASATISVDEYIEFMVNNSGQFDVLFVDYDSNFKGAGGDNMYKEGGYIYDNMTKLTKMGKLVFVCSQPKIGSWSNDTIELGDIAESSRKIHTADVLITISKGGMKYNPNHLGRMKIPKNRRGEEGVEVPYIRLNNGRFRVLTENVYSNLRSIPDKRFYTDTDIDKMIEQDMKNTTQAAAQAQAQVSQPQSKVTKKNSQQHWNPGANPFQQYFNQP